MKIYLVGGAVRDKILGLKIKDKDWVVVGSSYKDMIRRGFKPVGNNFPVFLHPETKEEYALARTEKKNGIGYNAFICYFSSKVSLKDDLSRRDLTINAIAIDKNDFFYDPFNGLIDIKKRILRNVSNSFVEDPLRVLRVARFYAFLNKFRFKINKYTLSLMIKISNSGELLSINSERIYKETEKVFRYFNLHYYFFILYKCKALNLLYPEIFYVFENKIFRNYFFCIFSKISFLYEINCLMRYNCRNLIKINFVLFFIFFDNIFFIKWVFDDLKFLLKKIFIFCNKLNIPKKIYFLTKRFLKFFNLFLNFKYKYKLSILILDAFYYLDIWRRTEDIKLFFILIKVVCIFPIKNYFLFLKIQKYFFKIINIMSNFDKKLLLNSSNGVQIKNNIYIFRLKKIEKFLFKHNF